MNYSEALDALLGWIGSPIRATVYDANHAPVLVLNGELGRAPDSSETADESRFFCVGHDHPSDGATGFFLPAKTFTTAHYNPNPEHSGDIDADLIVLLGGTMLRIERTSGVQA